MKTIVSLFFFLSILTASAETSFYRELAGRHAPVIYQGLGSNPKADVFTRVDFDGDFNSANNWKNLGKFGTLTPAVYFSVQETSEHYFITYALFYPRDYARICFWFHCHENDFEGLRVTVKKDGSHYGKVSVLETIAHGKSKYDRGPEIHPVFQSVSVVVEKEGHGIHSVRHRLPDQKYRRYSRNDYDLLPLIDLWEMREDVGKGRLWTATYNFEGKRYRVEKVPTSFAGEKWGKGLANPPWSWKGLGKTARKGEWFFDPLTSFCDGGECLEEPESEYLYNPFVF